MKQYPQEQLFLREYLQGVKTPEFSFEQQAQINEEILRLRKEGKASPFHTLLQLLPFLIIALSWYVLIFLVPQYITNKTLLFTTLFIVHGILGYQWVVYGLHEGAGHGLFKNNKTLNFLAFHSSRLFMADPVNYREMHFSHHKHTGTELDGAQTNFVLSKRIFISLLPGAGILFPNDYRIHKGDKFTLSQVMSAPVGLARFALEYYVLRYYFSLLEITLMLFLLSPWIGLVLDRIRESLEHHLMPQSRIYGTRELGTSALALFISGGPWGQACHLSHHLAPDLNWYQQLKLHHELKSILSQEQLDFFGFNTSFINLISQELQKHLHLEKKLSGRL